MDPNEYEDAILFAVTPKKQCLGIKVFDEPNLPDVNDNVAEDFEAYVDRCIQSAIDLKASIEKGIFDMDDPKIVQNFQTDYADVQQIVDENTKKIKHMCMLKQENHFIDLGRSMLDSVRIGRSMNVDACKICLHEMRVMSKGALTPLMLKKNPQIVHGVWKLCQYSDYELQDGQQVSSKSRTIQMAAIGTLNALKRVLQYNDCQEQFLTWFFESAKLFQELTRHLSDKQRTQLTIDPETELFKQSIV